MNKLLVFSIFIVCCCQQVTNSLNLPGPRVYVVTPSPRPPHSVSDEGRSAPFYYHNWMRRMDPPQNETTTTTTTTNSPDLIFAEFESGNQMKSIRKLLEREKIQPTTTSTTSRPIYVSDMSKYNAVDPSSSEIPEKKSEATKPVDMTDYFALYNNLYNAKSEELAPVYAPSTTQSSTSSTTSTTTTTTASPIANVENIWHIIDSQKYDQYPGQWEEESIESEVNNKEVKNDSKSEIRNDAKTEENEHVPIDENFALPGFATNSVNGAENESRAIHTEPYMRFPYVNLKPFQMKTKTNSSSNSISNSKKGNNMYTTLDNFHEMKNPVRGEVQDVVLTQQPIDRYNPAQPYLPDYRSKSKQSSPSAPPTQAVANLIPPPPPPPPRISDGNFPSPTNYESFPPYAPSAPSVSPPPPPPAAPPAPAPKPVLSYQPPVDTSDDWIADDLPSDSDDPPIDLVYRYKPPSPPSLPFVPTLPPITKPSEVYSYHEPPVSKPYSGYSYSKPDMTDDSPPDNSDKTDFHGYDYSKPGSDMDHGPPPPEDHGFPNDFPGYLKFNHDFEDYNHFHHYHYPHPTTTTTTDMPRVNRYSYYYLGKKLYYLPLYFSVYFIVYVGALIVKAVLRHKIVYPNSWRPNDQTASFFSKRSVDSWDLSNENLHEITGRVTHAIAVAGEKYFAQSKKK